MDSRIRDCWTVFTLLAAITAHADTPVIERCRQAESLEARVACLEQALTDSTEDVAVLELGVSAPMTPQETAAQVNKPLTESASPVTPDLSSQQAAETGERDEVRLQDQARATELGADQIKTQEQREASLASAQGLRVVGYETVPFRRLEVHLANGQVWRQIKGDTQELRASLRKNQTVDIAESSLGGYKLRLNEMRRTIRVRRVR